MFWLRSFWTAPYSVPVSAEGRVDTKNETRQSWLTRLLMSIIKCSICRGKPGVYEKRNKLNLVVKHEKIRYFLSSHLWSQTDSQTHTHTHTHDSKDHVELHRFKRTCSQCNFRKSNQVMRITESKLAAGCEKFQDFLFLQDKAHIHPIPSDPSPV